MKSFILNVLAPSTGWSLQQSDEHSQLLQAEFSFDCQEPLLKMLHTDHGETSRRNYFNHRTQPSSLDNRVPYNNAGHESPTQYIIGGPETLDIDQMVAFVI